MFDPRHITKLSDPTFPFMFAFGQNTCSANSISGIVSMAFGVRDGLDQTAAHHVHVDVVELGEDEDARRGGEGADQESVLLEVANVLPRWWEVNQQAAYNQR